MKRTNSLVQKLASIAPKAASLAIVVAGVFAQSAALAAKHPAITAVGTLPDGLSRGVYTIGARFYVFGLGTDNQLYTKYWDGSAWHPSQAGWEALGGVFVSPPTVTLARDDQSFDILELGTDNQMYHKYWDGSAWHPSQTGWEALGGRFVTPPAVTGFRDTGEDFSALNIFGIGTDNQMYHKSWDGNAWSPSQTGWEAMGGTFVSPPAAANVYFGQGGASQREVFGLSTDNQMFHKYWDGAAWHPWEALGGTFVSGPVAGGINNIELDVVGLGTDNQMYYKFWNGSSWQPSQTGWQALGGVFTSAPALVETGGSLNTTDVFALGTDNRMYHKSKPNYGIWQSQWEGLGGPFASTPAADYISLVGGGSQLHVVVLGTDNQMYHKYFDGTAWHPSQQGWEAIGGLFTIPE